MIPIEGLNKDIRESYTHIPRGGTQNSGGLGGSCARSHFLDKIGKIDFSRVINLS